jgi:hypothetical protein
MSDEATLRAKLRKIEALFAGAGTLGERAAAGAAAERIRARLKGTEKAETAIEIRLTVEDPWSRQLLIALCRRYGLRPYRYARMRRNTVVVKTPRSFLDEVLWPEFQEINAVLTEYLTDITDRVIREEIYGEAADADEVGGGR